MIDTKDTINESDATIYTVVEGDLMQIVSTFLCFFNLQIAPSGIVQIQQGVYCKLKN